MGFFRNQPHGSLALDSEIPQNALPMAGSFRLLSSSPVSGDWRGGARGPAFILDLASPFSQVGALCPRVVETSRMRFPSPARGNNVQRAGKAYLDPGSKSKSQTPHDNISHEGLRLKQIIESQDHPGSLCGTRAYASPGRLRNGKDRDGNWWECKPRGFHLSFQNPHVP